MLAVNCDMTSLKTTRLIESAQMRYVCTVHSRNKQNKVMVMVLFAALKIRPSSMCQQIQQLILQSQFQNCQLFNQTTSNIRNGLVSLGSDYACSPLNAEKSVKLRLNTEY